MNGKGASLRDAYHQNLNIKKALNQEEKAPSGQKSFESKFSDALVMFTDYALDLNGFSADPATPEQVLMALQVLAEEAGVRLPENINENKEASLKRFQEAWSLDDQSNIHDIFTSMVRAFGQNTSYGTPNDVSQTLSEMETPDSLNPYLSDPWPKNQSDPKEPGDVSDSDSNVNDEIYDTSNSLPNDVGRPPMDPAKFRAALNMFTSRLFIKNEVPRSPDKNDYQRVLNKIGEDLGLADADNLHMTTDMWAQAMDLDGNASISDIMKTLARVFNG